MPSRSNPDRGAAHSASKLAEGGKTPAVYVGVGVGVGVGVWLVGVGVRPELLPPPPPLQAATRPVASASVVMEISLENLGIWSPEHVKYISETKAYGDVVNDLDQFSGPFRDVLRTGNLRLDRVLACDWQNFDQIAVRVLGKPYNGATNGFGRDGVSHDFKPGITDFLGERGGV